MARCPDICAAQSSSDASRTDFPDHRGPMTRYLRWSVSIFSTGQFWTLNQSEELIQDHGINMKVVTLVLPVRTLLDRNNSLVQGIVVERFAANAKRLRICRIGNTNTFPLRQDGSTAASERRTMCRHVMNLEISNRFVNLPALGKPGARRHPPPFQSLPQPLQLPLQKGHENENGEDTDPDNKGDDDISGAHGRLWGFC